MRVISDYESYIRKHFRYENGVIYRDDREGGNGSLDKDGYLIIKIKGKQFKAHRLVWFLCKGYFPVNEIDHINRNRLDNRIENLRDVTRLENARNKTPIINKDTGCRKIYKDKYTKGLRAVYTFHYKGRTYRFRNLEDAKTKLYELESGDKQ